MKKLSSSVLVYFLKTQFNNNYVKLLQNIKKHPFYEYVSLSQMHETLAFLRQHFPEEIIHDHVYSILYPKCTVQISYETLTPEHRKLPPPQQLAFCIYKIEKKYNFTGEAVLNQRIEDKH